MNFYLTSQSFRACPTHPKEFFQNRCDMRVKRFGQSCFFSRSGCIFKNEFDITQYNLLAKRQNLVKKKPCKSHSQFGQMIISHYFSNVCMTIAIAQDKAITSLPIFYYKAEYFRQGSVYSPDKQPVLFPDKYALHVVFYWCDKK